LLFRKYYPEGGILWNHIASSENTILREGSFGIVLLVRKIRWQYDPGGWLHWNRMDRSVVPGTITHFVATLCLQGNSTKTLRWPKHSVDQMDEVVRSECARATHATHGDCEGLGVHHKLGQEGTSLAYSNGNFDRLLGCRQHIWNHPNPSCDGKIYAKLVLHFDMT